MVFHKKITENGNFKMREKTETASVISAVHFFGFGDQTSSRRVTLTENKKSHHTPVAGTHKAGLV